MYLAKLEEEANYFTVSENEPETDICTCHTCIVSSKMKQGLYLQYETIFCIILMANLSYHLMRI